MYFEAPLSPHKGTAAPSRAVPGRGRSCPAAPGALPHTGGSSPATPARGRLLLLLRPDLVPRRRGETAPPAPPGSSHLATWRLPAARPRRRRLPVVAGREAAAAGSERRPRRPHRGAVTMGRTPSPAPSGSHRRRGGGRRGGRRRHLERGVGGLGSRPPPS